MPPQKVDYQKINSLKAKVYDRMVEIEQHSLAVQNLQKEVVELNKEIEVEQNKIAKK